MIDLTPIDIRKKKGDFARAFRGYDVADVDLFLDLVADRMEELINGTRRLEERVAQLEAQMHDYRQRETALTEAVVTAQELREDVKRQAAREAELARREAEMEAERIRAAAVKAREQEEELLRRLRTRRMQLLRSFRSFLERELAELAVIAQGIEAMEAETADEAAPGAEAPRRAVTKPVAAGRADDVGASGQGR
ncbi:MAG TPA: DivIVA domain-containing protein [Longimicrobiales bacterium]